MTHYTSLPTLKQRLGTEHKLRNTNSRSATTIAIASQPDEQTTMHDIYNTRVGAGGFQTVKHKRQLSCRTSAASDTVRILGSKTRVKNAADVL
jgi:hypothetical protein